MTAPTADFSTPPDVFQAFEQSYDVIVGDILDDLESKYKLPAIGMDRMRNMLQHNVKGGKMNRGLAVIDTLRIIARHQNRSLSEKETFLAHVAGWAIEWLQACFLVSDDIMDQSVTRRGKPCWYRMPGVGLEAVNDALLLEGHIYVFIKKYFRDQEYYADLLDLIHEVSYVTELGQMIDMQTAPPENQVDFSEFSMERHSYIVVHKTAYYSFYLSVAMAFMIAGVKTPVAFHQAKQILLPLGEYFQVQDDYLDAYADPIVLGKVGTDIQDNKCSWLINMALMLANKDQRELLNQNYGRKDQICIDKVKSIYLDLNLQHEFQRYEQASFDMINRLIDQVDVSLGIPREVYQSFLQKIYQRNK